MRTMGGDLTVEFAADKTSFFRLRLALASRPGTRLGSFGQESSGMERSEGGFACVPQQVSCPCCLPLTFSDTNGGLYRW